MRRMVNWINSSALTWEGTGHQMKAKMDGTMPPIIPAANLDWPNKNAKAKIVKWVV